MHNNTFATLSVLFVSLVWGVEFVLIDNAINILEPHTFNLMRFGVASLFILLCLLAAKAPLIPQLNRRLLFHGVVLGSLLYLGFTLQTFGLLYTSVSNCGFITSLNIVMVPLMALVILGDKPAWYTLSGVAVATGGLYLLTAAGQGPFNIGDLLTLGCAAMFALHIVLTSKLGRHHSALPLTLIQLTTVTLLSLISTLISEDAAALLQPEILSSTTVWLAVLVAAILGTGLAFMIQTLAQQRLSSTRVALMLSLEPVFAALAAFIVLNEQLPAVATIGAALILGGVLLAELPQAQRQQG